MNDHSNSVVIKCLMTISHMAIIAICPIIVYGIISFSEIKIELTRLKQTRFTKEDAAKIIKMVKEDDFEQVDLTVRVLQLELLVSKLQVELKDLKKGK